MSATIMDLMESLSTDPATQRAFADGPTEFLGSSGLPHAQRETVLSGDVSALRELLAEHGTAPGCGSQHVILIAVAARH